jgi:hypothetical protein
MAGNELHADELMWGAEASVSQITRASKFCESLILLM